MPYEPHHAASASGERVSTPSSPARAASRIALAVALVASQAACSTLGVQPWERELLATPAMQLDSAPLLSGFDEHTYFSKEAASGGRGFGGGGCGCN
jgi:hypothetical protein